MQVESARADMMGVSFGIDFSGSTNFVVIPPAAPTTASLPSIPATDSANVEPAKHGPSASSTSLAGTTGHGDGAGKKEEDCNNSTVGGTPKAMARDEAAAGRNDEEGDAAAGGESGEALEGMSARVSTGAFRRTVVARVTVRDPNVGGTIKVEKAFRIFCLEFHRCCSTSL